MKITSIKAQVKNPERVSVFVDGTFTFSLSYTQLLEAKIHTGIEIDQARLATLRHQSDFGKAFERALNYVLLRPRSTRELQDYARRKKWTPEDANAIIEKLQTMHYLDDRNFARAWVEQRKLGAKTSQRKLRLELKQKGVADTIIAEVLEQVGFRDDEALNHLIAKKRRLPRYAHDDQKLTQYLVRQGFSYDDVKIALNH